MTERPSRSLLNKPSSYDDTEHYPAICIHQPYAGLIWLAGMGELGADIVVRPKRIAHRGPMVIAASRRTDPEAYQRVQRMLVGGGIMRLPEYEAACGHAFEGKTVALVDIADCRHMTDKDRQRAFVSSLFDMRAQFAWPAGKIVALSPFETIGAQAVFRIRRELVDGAKRRETTRAQRDALWKALAKRRKDLDCECGAEYVVKRGKFVAKQQNAEVAHGA